MCAAVTTEYVKNHRNHACVCTNENYKWITQTFYQIILRSKKSVKREKAIIFQGNDLLSNSLIFFSYVKNDRLFILKIGQVKDNTDKIDPWVLTDGKSKNELNLNKNFIKSMCQKVWGWKHKTKK